MTTTCHRINHDAVISAISFERLKREIGARTGYIVNQAAHGLRHYHEMLLKVASDIRYHDKRMVVTFEGHGFTWQDNKLILDQAMPTAMVAAWTGQPLGKVVKGTTNPDQRVLEAATTKGKSYLILEDRDLAIRNLPEGHDRGQAMLMNGINDFLSLFETGSRSHP